MDLNKKTYRSNGKLLLTGEYVVLDGARALALPTTYGQSLIVQPKNSNTINWKSYNELNDVWYKDEFLLEDNEILKQGQNGNAVSNRLIEILIAAKTLNPHFLNEKEGFDIATHQDFNRLWGLGTSSTLINNIADWAKVDAYKLLNKTFGGSGYDIACAKHNTAITFRLKNNREPLVNSVKFNPSFKNQLYFVYLNQKQNSRDGIASYKKLSKLNNSIIEEINNITDAIIKTETLSGFNALIDSHEAIISKLIQQDTVKSKFFKDFKGSVKSLGAWGGDFVLVTSEAEPSSYFKSKGFDTVIPYSNMVL